MHVKDVNKGVRTFFLSAASRFNQANVSNEAIVISYYALLAIIPLMIFIGNLLPLLHLKASTVLAYIEMAIPRSIYQTLKPFIIQYLENGSSGGAASISGLISVWAASRGFNAMKRSLNVAYLPRFFAWHSCYCSSFIVLGRRFLNIWHRCLICRWT